MSSLRDSLQAIYDQHGKLTPELVVQVARKKTHPLHSQVFDRAPADAAEAWYRHRAHELIQSVKVTYREATETSPALSVRAFVAVRSSEGDNSYSYEPTEKVATDPFSKALVLRDMERDWKTLKSRYEAFEEFFALVAGDLKAA